MPPKMQSHLSPVPATVVSPQECEQLFQTQATSGNTQALGIHSRLPCTSRARQLAEPDWDPIQQPWVLDLQLRDQSLRSLLWIDPQLEVFAGHFPGQPILPGVVQLDWCQQLATKVWPADYPAADFNGVQNLKFKAPVLPAELLALVLTQQPGKIVFKFCSPTEVRSQGTLLYRA